VAVNAVRRAGARIAVTGAGGSSEIARSFLRSELDGVHVVDLERCEGDALDESLAGANILVFVADAGDDPDEARIAAVADAAREHGILLSALVVDRRPAMRSRLLGVLRDAVDMVMIVRDAEDVLAVVAALR
jgi:hypothetical protein